MATTHAPPMLRHGRRTSRVNVLEETAAAMRMSNSAEGALEGRIRERREKIERLEDDIRDVNDVQRSLAAKEERLTARRDALQEANDADLQLIIERNRSQDLMAEEVLETETQPAESLEAMAG